MNRINLIFSILATVSGITHTVAASRNSLVTTNNLKATGVVKSLRTGETETYNPQPAEEQFLPASTVKTPNTRIPLQTGPTKGLHDTIRWDGQQYPVIRWNHDQCLNSAFPMSCVWFYQELASQVGNDTFLGYLHLLHYGNQQTGPDLRTFGLDSDLRISAFGQISFLEKVHSRQFPFENQYDDRLTKVMLTDSTAAYRLYAKSDWSARVEVETCWYVEYMVTAGDVWFFACNLQLDKETDALFRKDLAYRFLRDLPITS